MSTNPILSKHEDVVELATKIGQDIGGVTNLQTADKTSVVAAINEVLTAVDSIGTSLDDDYAKKSDLTPLATKSEVAEDIGGVVSDLTEAIEYVQISTGEIYAEKSELTPLATKADVSKDIGNLANLPTDDKTSVVASINELLNNVNVALGSASTSINNINTELVSNYAKKTELSPLATKTEVAKDIGVVTNLQTANKTNLVAAINELKTADTSFANTYAKKTELTPLAKKTDLTPLATKAELTQAITDLINGADADSDTLKELADKITALAQADNGLVSAGSAQSFNATQKKRARDNIGAISEADVNGILEAQSGGDYVSAYLQASQ